MPKKTLSKQYHLQYIIDCASFSTIHETICKSITWQPELIVKTFDTNISFVLFKTPANIRYLPMNYTEIKIKKKKGPGTMAIKLWKFYKFKE